MSASGEEEPTQPNAGNGENAAESGPSVGYNVEQVLAREQL